MPSVDFTQVHYEQELDSKLSSLAKNFQLNDIELPSAEVYRSPLINFRMRAEFRIWHENETVNYAMHHPETKEVYTIDEFPIASLSICKRMKPLLETINQNYDLRHKLFQVEFLSTTKDDVLISLIYHRPLDSDWEKQATKLAKKLSAHIIGRSRKQKVVLSQDFVMEEMIVNNTSFHYQQIENSFTQPNAAICQSMLQWATDQAKKINSVTKQDLLELYCGNGNFTLPLSTQFKKVLATEVSKTSVRSAQFNIQKNNIENVDIIRLSSEETVQALNKERDFRRLKEIDINSYDFSTVLVDPPRAGLDPITLELAKRFKNIIYISCNPDSFIKNIDCLSDFSIKDFAVFDQFPYTRHLEIGAVLIRERL